MQNDQVARVFDELADLLEIQKANPFRVRAYRNAARTITSLSQSVADLVEDQDADLTQLDGIGKDLAQKIETIVRTGTLPQLEELRQQVPAGVRDMLRIPGLGPKKVGALFGTLNITSLDELRAAAEAGTIAELKGFGKKTQQHILDNIDRAAAAEQRMRLAEAKIDADRIVGDLRQVPGVLHADAAGSCRRRKETVGDLDILVTATNPSAVMDALEQHSLVESVLQRGDTKQRVRLYSGLELDLRVVPDESYGAALVYFTGSREHCIVLRRRGQERGLKINEYGVYRGDEVVAGRTEEDVYAAVDLPWIPPELRENRGEFELAEEGRLPALLELSDIRGDLHMHTQASDGRATITAMAEAAKQRGLKYIAITDHSKRVSMANGLDEKRLLAEWAEVDRVNSELGGIEILKGVECDILEDATLDLSDDCLAQADWVIAVLHYGLKQPREQIMKRLMAAVTNPHVDIIGHPSGRLIGKRDGAEIDFTDLFQAAADHGVMMEINAHPNRLDLNEFHAAACRDLGIPIVISTDAHSEAGLDVMQYGVYQARRAGLEKKDVANTRNLAQFRKLLRT